MGNTKKRIALSKKERKELTKFATTGLHSAMMIRRAQIILDLDAADGRQVMPEAEIAKVRGVTRQTVQNVKSDYLSRGIENFLMRKKRDTPPVPPKVDGAMEAHIIALSCSDPPEGYARWSVRLLADKAVELGYVESISHMTVSRLLKKTNLSLT
jgi:hypothetical protein